MITVSCRKCGAHMEFQIHPEYITAGCTCGVRAAAQYIFFWKQIPAMLRPYALKAFGTHGKWRVDPLCALKHVLNRERIAAQTSGIPMSDNRVAAA